MKFLIIPHILIMCLFTVGSHENYALHRKTGPGRKCAGMLILFSLLLPRLFRNCKYFWAVSLPTPNPGSGVQM